MSSSLIIGLEMALVLGGVLAFGFYELLSLRRERRRDAARHKAETSDD